MILGSATLGQQKQPVRIFETNLYERPDIKPIKVKMHSYSILLLLKIKTIFLPLLLLFFSLAFAILYITQFLLFDAYLSVMSSSCELWNLYTTHFSPMDFEGDIFQLVISSFVSCGIYSAPSYHRNFDG
jgi:hypothetical protein